MCSNVADLKQCLGATLGFLFASNGLILFISMFSKLCSTVHCFSEEELGVPRREARGHVVCKDAVRPSISGRFVMHVRR